MAIPEKKELVEREVAHAAGHFITRESDRQALITVTHADVSPDFANAIVFVSVLPETEEQNALAFLKRARSNFRSFVAKEMRFKRVPTFDFALDIGEKNRQQVQNL